MWKPRRVTTLWASTACYKGSFTFFYVDTYFIYYFCDENAEGASAEYHCCYPDRRQPNRRMSATAQRRLGETVAFMLIAHAGRGRGSGQNEEEVLNVVHINQSTGIRRVADEAVLAYSAGVAIVSYLCTTCSKATARGQ
jgi:hypothetical protein